MLLFNCIPAKSRRGLKTGMLPLALASFCTIVVLCVAILFSPNDELPWDVPATALYTLFLFSGLPAEKARMRVCRSARSLFLLLNARGIDRALPL